MENIDPQSAFAAFAVGGMILFGAVRMFAGFGGSEETVNQASTATKQTDGKKKAKKKKKKADAKAKAKAKVEQEEKKAQPKAEKKKVEKHPGKKKTEPVKVEEPPAESPKKKKKRKKKKKPAAKKDDSDSSDLDEQPNKAPESPAKKEITLKASDLVQDDFIEEDGWETVPIKPRRKNVVSGLNDSDVQVEQASGTKSKKKIRETVSIGEYASVVLGEGGSTITNIQNRSGAKVNVNKEQKVCIVTGDEQSVDVAKQLIQSLVSNQTKEILTVTSRLDKAILGKSETMQKIRELSGAKVDYAFGGRDDPMKVTITGEIDKVSYAKTLIADYLEGKTPEGLDGIKRIQINGFQGRILIGQKGAQITALQKKSGASINIEFVENNAKALVTVIGTQQQIEAGLEEIKKFLSEHMYSTSVQLDAEARSIMTKLNDLRKDIPNLKIDVSDDRTQINLTGSEQGVTKGRATLLGWIKKELDPPEIGKGEIMEEIDLEGAAGKVIGKNKSSLNSILEKSPGAKIVIKHGTICYIYGTPEGVAKASEQVNAILTKHKQIVAKSEEERKELEKASWVVLDVSELSAKRDFAPESDWGGFQLAQAQGW